jgi:hypothetical protein
VAGGCVILANYAQQNRNTVREIGNQLTNPLAMFKPGQFQSFYTPDDPQTGRDLSAFNHGYNSEYAWSLPHKSGGIASTLNIRGAGTMSANALAVKLAQAALTGTGDLTAVGGLIVQLIAAITGSGTVTAADVQAFLAAVANLTGSGTVSDANIKGFGELLAALSGLGTLDASTLTGTGTLSADLVVTGTGLSTSNVGQAVWAALAAANNAAGTMGEKLNDAGSASNPWTEVIESGYTAAEILRLIAATLANDAEGLEGSSPVFKSLDGSKDRITATYDAGTRTITGRDAS